MATANLRRRINSRAERGLDRMPSSTRVRANNLLPSNKLLTFIDEREAAGRFSTVAQGFSEGELATISRSTKGSAKNWKAGRVFPNGATLINLARNNPVIRSWLLHEIGETAEFDDPRVLARAMVLLQQAQKEMT
jgi:hypothetical protein